MAFRKTDDNPISDGDAELLAHEPRTGTVVSPRPHDQFKDYLARVAESTTGTRSLEVAQNQMDKILNADSAQDIWNADEGGTVNGQDMVDVELEIRGYQVAKSDEQYDAALGVYALIDATRLDTGETVVINTGAPLIIAKLRMFEVKGLLPILGVIRGTQAKNGTVLKLKPIPPRAVSSETVA